MFSFSGILCSDNYKARGLVGGPPVAVLGSLRKRFGIYCSLLNLGSFNPLTKPLIPLLYQLSKHFVISYFCIKWQKIWEKNPLTISAIVRMVKVFLTFELMIVYKTTTCLLEKITETYYIIFLSSFFLSVLFLIFALLPPLNGHQGLCQCS